jgi:hypothetical protein
VWYSEVRCGEVKGSVEQCGQVCEVWNSVVRCSVGRCVEMRYSEVRSGSVKKSVKQSGMVWYSEERCGTVR